MKTKNLFLSLLFIALFCNLSKVKSQSTSTGPFSSALTQNLPGTTADFLGWATGSKTLLTNKSLVIKTEEDMPINFYTNAGLAAYNFQKMIILGTTHSLITGSDDGYVGIGYAPFTTFASGTFPYYRLDVDSGDINVNPPVRRSFLGGLCARANYAATYII